MDTILPPTPKFRFELDLDRRLNYALQQNDVPVFRSIKIINDSEEDLTDCILRLQFQPAMAKDTRIPIAEIAPGDAMTLTTPEIILLPGFLEAVQEKTNGVITISLHQGERLLLEQTEKIEVLAKNEWGGIRILPEILAAFVLPNDPIIEQILLEAGEILRKATDNPNIDGYQSNNPKRIYQITSGIYNAILKHGLTYINPPASFETEGQKIRFPEHIMHSGMGTCLDISLLFAACLEQAGLHPIVFLVPQHAFVGLWLFETYFPHPVYDDPASIKKRVDLGEILPLDPTALTANQGFQESVAIAKNRLAGTQHNLLSFDIKRSRKGKIRPLPITHKRDDSDRPAREANQEIPISIPALNDIDLPESFPEGQLPDHKNDTRLDRWKRKLLDMSLRNRLLNFTEGKQTVPILCPALGTLEDNLAAGQTYEILPQPKDFSEYDPRRVAAATDFEREQHLKEILEDSLHSMRIHARLDKQELNRRLLKIYRTAQTAREEGGSTALFLALGFLVWYKEGGASEPKRLAPILLVPIELIRVSMDGEYEFRLSDEEPRVNLTLREMLQRDHGIEIQGLDPLPEDASGVDTQKILNAFRSGVKNIPKWDVQESASIGFFSFAKYQLWQDLEKNEFALLQNKLVAHLIQNPNEKFEPELNASFPDGNKIDAELASHRIMAPTSADSSQIAAIIAADMGYSFVLKGPPGTGKSQTITNLIAHCLANGKTILFVSEKLAALQVVHKRLQAIGLAPFCLELHSNKAQKDVVIRELQNSANHYSFVREDRWLKTAGDILEITEKLNAYIQALHKKRPIGYSIFDGISTIIKLKAHKTFPFEGDDPDHLPANLLDDYEKILTKLEHAFGHVGDVKDNVFSAVRQEEYTPGWKRRVDSTLARAIDATTNLLSSVHSFSEKSALPVDDGDLNLLHRIAELANLLKQNSWPTPELIQQSLEPKAIQARIATFVEVHQTHNELKARQTRSFKDSILEADVEAILVGVRERNQAGLLSKLFSKDPATAIIKQHLQKDVSLKGTSLEQELETVISLTKSAGELKQIQSELDVLFTAELKQDPCPEQQLNEELNRAVALNQALTQIEQTSTITRADLLEAYSKWSDSETSKTSMVAWAEDMTCSRFPEWEQAMQEITELMKVEEQPSMAWTSSQDSGIGHLTTVLARLQAWQEHVGDLQYWCFWQECRNSAREKGLQPIMEAVAEGIISGDSVKDVFLKSFFTWWTEKYFEKEAALRNFFSEEHTWSIETYIKTDAEYSKLTREVIAARLSLKATQSLETGKDGLLRREFQKQRRHIPIRKLFDRIHQVVMGIKPCILMSPISVAQYLDINGPKFDLVIFDEASQIPVWDAIGVIARGKQTIVVGDPKQLPPTSFFEKSEANDEQDFDDETLVDDMESILDDCVASGMKTMQLKWHYRSRHESLITFSNHHYYDNQLLTFPSKIHEGLGITFRHLEDGVYDRGKSRTNQVEARAVVAEIVRRLKDPKLRERTIGVVTFSQAQQTLVEDLLDKERTKHPDINQFFTDKVPEPVFVKNLENVQGDERDSIFFSVCYGPDASGYVAMNFGPLNNTGGERRLNVAITRARLELVVYSSLRHTDIDLARTRATGIKHFKNFLAYAQLGPDAIAQDSTSKHDPDSLSPFELDVLLELQKLGWEVHQQVGCSGYRIDLAVVNPDHKDEYLMGIECDGRTYHQARTARDRDILRQSVLEGLGWKLFRIWSADWMEKEEVVVNHLDEALKKELELVRELKAKEALEMQALTVTPDSVEDDQMEDPSIDPSNNDFVPDAQTESEWSNSVPAAQEEALVFASATTTEPTYPDTVEKQAGIVAEASGHRYIEEPYIVAENQDGGGTADDFTAIEHTQVLRRDIEQIVRVEGPICLKLLAKRLGERYDFSKVTTKKLTRVEEVVRFANVRLETDHNEEAIVLWPADLTTADFKKFRPNVDGETNVRNAQEIPIQEFMNCVHWIMLNGFQIGRTELQQQTSRKFGFGRTGKQIADRIDKAIERLIKDNHLQEEPDGSISVVRPPA
ncbi:MAG: DUF3320 domain-containing protein [Verrucomicrobiota bacterium]|nr:DUF3320 domain-containing protein [Verrucomicrobiota bacterium]